MQVFYGDIYLPLNFNHGFCYQVDHHAVIGHFVHVTFRKRYYVGIINHISTKPPPNLDIKKIKHADIISGLNPLAIEQLKFIKWLAYYYANPLGLVIKAMLGPKQIWQQHEQKRIIISLHEDYQQYYHRKSQKRDHVIEILQKNQKMMMHDICQQLHISQSMITQMIKQNILKKSYEKYIPEQKNIFNHYNYQSFKLTEHQQNIANHCATFIKEQKFTVILLDGETGAGKSETYFHSIAETLAIGKNILVLMPEISLLSQWLDNFNTRFNNIPGQWHSHMNMRERRLLWQAANNGKLRVLCGARSALHLPFDNIGLIIVDEEHERSYKQEDGIMYHARDSAIMRAKLSHCPIILVSATPTIETYHHAMSDKYHYFKLRRRDDQAHMPIIETIDMTDEILPKNNWISQKIQHAISITLQQKQQAMLFLNRRGYAPLLLCRGCGYRFSCQFCQSWLIKHYHYSALLCHHCGYKTSLPNHCPECHSEHLHPCGPGVERIEEEAKKLFPHARIAIMTSDHMQDMVLFQQVLEDIQQRHIDIIVTTQILAKGVHFDHLHLVGIIDADIGLQGGDFRAGEHCYQLLHQLSGRAGRLNQQGRVLMQTYNPHHNVMKALTSGQRDIYLQEETHYRQENFLPPFGHVAALIVTSQDNNAAIDACDKLKHNMPSHHYMKILGPAPAMMSFLRNKYRYRFLILLQYRDMALGETLQQWIIDTSISSRVKITIDIDPQSFF